MSKNKSSGNGFFQAQSQLGFGGMGMINPFNERQAAQQHRDRHEYERQALMQQQRHVEYNQMLVKGMEEELVKQETVDEDEEIYYLLT